MTLCGLLCDCQSQTGTARVPVARLFEANEGLQDALALVGTDKRRLRRAAGPTTGPLLPCAPRTSSAIAAKPGTEALSALHVMRRACAGPAIARSDSPLLWMDVRPIIGAIAGTCPLAAAGFWRACGAMRIGSAACIRALREPSHRTSVSQHEGGGRDTPDEELWQGPADPAK